MNQQREYEDEKELILNKVIKNNPLNCYTSVIYQAIANFYPNLVSNIK